MPPPFPRFLRVVASQDTKHRPGGPGREKAPAGRSPAGAKVLPLGGTFRDALSGAGSGCGAVAVLVVGRDQVGVAEDAVLVDVEAVEFLIRLHPDADGRLQRREDPKRGDEDEAAAGDDAQSLDAELVEATAVEEAGLADRGQGGGREQAARERAPDAAHP